MVHPTLSRLAGLVLVPVALAFAGVAPVLAGAMPDAPPTLAINSNATPDWYDVQLANFHPDEQVGYTLIGPGQQMFGGNAHTITGNGDLAFNFKLPRAAEAGVWTITVQGDKDDEAVGSFTAAAQDPNIDVSANLDDSGASELLSITSHRNVFNAGDPITYWLVNPAGDIVQSGVVNAGKRGELDLSLPVSAVANGPYTVEVYGWHDDVFGAAPVTIA